MVYQETNPKERGRKNKNDDLNMLCYYTNIDGINSKKLEMDEIIRRDQPQVVCLTETKLNQDLDTNIIFSEGYNVWRYDRKEKKGGGVAILVRNIMTAKQVELENGKAEVVAVEFNDIEGRKLDIAAVYMPPKTRAWREMVYEEMVEDMIQSLRRLLLRRNRLILVGDFNCREVDWDSKDAGLNQRSWGSRLLELVTENLLTQHVKESTRMRGTNEPSRLDLIFTKDPHEISEINYLCAVGKSDHLLLKWQLISSKANIVNDNYRNDRLNYSKTDYVSLRRYFEGVDWNLIMQEQNIQGKYNKFLEIYGEGIKQFVPKFKNGNFAKQKEWFNLRCKRALDRRDAAWARVRRRNTERNWNKYKQERNRYVNIIREVKKNYEKNIVNKCESDPKLFYRYINSKLKVKKQITKLRVDDKTYENVTDMCEVMNNGMGSVFNKDEIFDEPQIGELEDEGLSRVEITREELLFEMRGLEARKAMGPDEVSAWVLKECADQLVDPVRDIIQASLDRGLVPVEWKRANIIPIHKSGSTEDPLNYRPISLTSIVCKICEKLIKKRWMTMLESKKIITPKQFGFREGSSCATSLLCFYNRVIDVLQERDGWVDCIYLDLSKAFDKVPHMRLISKLMTIGCVRGSLLKWMTSFLTDRKMRISIRGAYSSWRKVESGVPQGSVLAPVMFLMYVNDLPIGINSYMSMFADDVKILRKITNRNSCEELQRDLDKIYKWSTKWKMKFNTGKCHVLEMGRSENRPNWEYRMGNNIISKAEKEKDLGVIIQNNLSPEKHINKLVSGIYTMSGNMKVALNYLDENMLAKIIKSMIRPRLEYAAVVWSPHLKKHVNKLEKIQRSVTRLVPSLREMSYEGRLEKLNLPSLKERRERGDMIMMYKCTLGLVKLDKDDIITRDTGITRGHSYKVKKPICKNDIKKFSFPYRSIEQWNRLAEEVVRARNIHIFKQKLDESGWRDGTTRA